jgi:hypothetical protein
MNVDRMRLADPVVGDRVRSSELAHVVAGRDDASV